MADRVTRGSWARQGACSLGRACSCAGPRSGAARVWVLALVLLALVGLGGWQAAGLLVGEEVRVPAVAGLDYEEAVARLHDVGLAPHPYAELDARARANEVLSQSPAAGQAVRPGRVVALGVNAVPEVRIAPDLVGLREADAVVRAGAVGAVVGRVVYVHAERPVGTVVRQEPAAGVTLAEGQDIAVSVSRGAVDVPFALPDLRGQPIEVAEAALANLGVRHVERVAAAVSFDRAGAVTDQRPAAGSEVLAATPVTLVYAVEGTRVVQVPDLTGLPLWRAQLALRAARLELGAVRRIEDAALPDGVVEATPGGYTLVGSPIAVVVNGSGGQLELDGYDGLLWPGELDWPSETGRPPAFGGPAEGAARGTTSGPAGGGVPLPGVPAPEVAEPEVPAPGTARTEADGSRIIPFRFDPSSVGIASLAREAYGLRLVISDDEGERVAFDRQLAAGERVEISVRVVGDEAMLQTFINGSFFQAWRP
ncbi:MAG: PASTA domain-containing protein [Trueperaceae bacterium]|nr:PASTA domain-containing protein [Trueperaceae bacterium]